MLASNGRQKTSVKRFGFSQIDSQSASIKWNLATVRIHHKFIITLTEKSTRILIFCPFALLSTRMTQRLRQVYEGGVQKVMESEMKSKLIFVKKI